jgi:hypothetical protein
MGSASSDVFKTPLTLAAKKAPVIANAGDDTRLFPEPMVDFPLTGKLKC